MIYRADLKSMAKEQIRGNIGILFLCGLVVAVTGCVVSLVPFLGAIAVAIVSPAISISFIYIYLGLTRGERPKIEDIFKGLNIFGKAFLLYFVMGIFIFLWSLLLYVPGIIKAISYMFAPYILAENPEIGVMEAINESKRITQGHKLELFVLDLSFILWALLVVVTFGIAIIYVGPYIQATTANAYLKLKYGDVIITSEARN